MFEFYFIDLVHCLSIKLDQHKDKQLDKTILESFDISKLRNSHIFLLEDYYNTY